MTYRFYNGVCNADTMMALMTENDAKETERNRQAVRLIPLDYDRNAVPDCGYTGFAVLDNGDVYVVNYIKDDAEKAQIRGYRFCPNEWIL